MLTSMLLQDLGIDLLSHAPKFRSPTSTPLLQDLCPSYSEAAFNATSPFAVMSTLTELIGCPKSTQARGLLLGPPPSS